MHMQIRRATANDAAIIADYNQRMAWETEHKQLPTEVVQRGVRRVFDDERRGFYFVAERGDEIIGQLMITYEWSDWRDGWIWWIQSVYVREDVRRQGVFRALYAQVVTAAQAHSDVIGIRLYVEKANTRAQATYEQQGMTDAGYVVFETIFP